MGKRKKTSTSFTGRPKKSEPVSDIEEDFEEDFEDISEDEIEEAPQKMKPKKAGSAKPPSSLNKIPGKKRKFSNLKG